MDFILAYITTRNKEEATSIGKKLLEARIAACINIIESMESMYWWEGKIETSTECVLLVKTKKSYSSRLIDEIKKIHSYEIPCVLTLQIIDGTPEYLNWLSNELKN